MLHVLVATRHHSISLTSLQIALVMEKQFLLVVVVGCNNGVETGKGATGSKYNGEVYAPTNIGEDK